MTGFGANIYDSQNEMRGLILDAGIAPNKVNDVLLEMIKLAQGNPVIEKISYTVVYIALESSDTNKCAAILGVNTWTNVKVILDASVAIPFLCSSIFSSSMGRFSLGSNETVNLLRSQSAQLTIPHHYLNECASHLVGAYEYCKCLDDFESVLAFSNNGYVSHYYQLKEARKKVPESLEKYLSYISSNSTKYYEDKHYKVRRVMLDLQPNFAEYGVLLEDVPKIPDKYLIDIQNDYLYAMRALNRKKYSNLIEHDTQVLAHILRNYTEKNEKIICLTWDGVMIAVGAQTAVGGWIVSPVEAGDLIQSRLRISRGRLLSLAHSVASTIEIEKAISARILDRIVQIAGEKLDDWEMRQKIKEFQTQALARIDLTKRDFDMSMFDHETDTFLKQQGISIDNHID